MALILHRSQANAAEAKSMSRAVRTIPQRNSECDELGVMTVALAGSQKLLWSFPCKNALAFCGR